MTNLISLDLSEENYRIIRDTIYNISGICLTENKKELIKSRLMKRMRLLGISGFSEYIDFLRSDSSGRELSAMVDILTTNKTSFFRESQHFEYLAKEVLPKISNRRLRIWSAGCSSGEEPYTIAMVLHESISDISSWDIKILATDISSEMLEIAVKGVYDQTKVSDIPPNILRRYFIVTGNNGSKLYRPKEQIRSMIRFARLNLLAKWPMKGPFDAIFCRNVMIYFDQETRQKLVARYWELLRRGGHLFVGCSESLSSIQHKFDYVKPAVYRKP